MRFSSLFLFLFQDLPGTLLERWLHIRDKAFPQEVCISNVDDDSTGPTNVFCKISR